VEWFAATFCANSRLDQIRSLVPDAWDFVKMQDQRMLSFDRTASLFHGGNAPVEHGASIKKVGKVICIPVALDEDNISTSASASNSSPKVHSSQHAASLIACLACGSSLHCRSSCPGHTRTSRETRECPSDMGQALEGRSYRRSASPHRLAPEEP